MRDGGDFERGLGGSFATEAEAHTAPQGRSGAAMVHRQEGDAELLVLFGGYDGMSELDDLWLLKLLPEYLASAGAAPPG